jgi:hypothetical protein
MANAVGEDEGKDLYATFAVPGLRGAAVSGGDR